MTTKNSDGARAQEGGPEAATRETSGRTARRGRPRVRHELVEREIKQNAARLFAERGVSGTTLQDIADATGLTRQAVYHYVANKDELFSQLVTDVVDEPAHILHAINSSADLQPADKLRQMATAIAQHQMENSDRFRLMIRSEAELPENLLESYHASRRTVLKEFIAVIDEGVAAGQFRDVEPRLAALGIIGMLNWLAWWYQPGGENSSVAGDLADLCVHSVEASCETDTAKTSPSDLISNIRRELNQLDALVKGPSTGTN